VRKQEDVHPVHGIHSQFRVGPHRGQVTHWTIPEVPPRQLRPGLSITCFSHRYMVKGIQDVRKLAKKISPNCFKGVIDPLKRFLHLKMLNSNPK
jgi:hypothetical protein